jgi:hypothetical protein
MASVFISYRRSDCPGHAGRLYDRVANRVGPDNVFIDVEAIALGDDFAQAIARAIGSCSVFLALIGKDWLDSVDREGRRLDHPDDLVRFEIATALQLPGLRVIPVLVANAVMPDARELPPDLQPLARRNAFELRDTHWRYDVDQLLDEVQPGPPSPPGRPGEGRTWRSRRTAVVAAVAGLAVLAAFILPHIIDPGPGPQPGPARGCADGKDNDHDGLTDFPDDHGCASAENRTERGACQDHKDNDGDHKIDYSDDPGCSSPDDPAEKVAACFDREDNDDDGATDFPADKECASKDDPAEQS